MDRRAWRVPLGPKELGTSEATVFTNVQACMRHFKTTTLEQFQWNYNNYNNAIIPLE